MAPTTIRGSTSLAAQAAANAKTADATFLNDSGMTLNAANPNSA